MPVSKKRKPKKVISHKPVAPVQSKYLDDFVDEAIDSLQDGDFGLIAVLDDAHIYDEFGEKYYYILSRNSDGRLLEHNEGPAFVNDFNKMVKFHKEQNMDVKIVVGYFNKDQVSEKNGGVAFGLPHLALQWKMDGETFIPDDSDYDWNGYMVQPGGWVK